MYKDFFDPPPPEAKSEEKTKVKPDTKPDKKSKDKKKKVTFESNGEKEEPLDNDGTKKCFKRFYFKMEANN